MKFGNTGFNLKLDDSRVLQVVDENELDITESEDSILDKALQCPIDSAKLSELVHPGETVCIVIPDITRSWQGTHKYLYKIVDELEKGGVREQDIRFLSGLGTHRKQTPEEHRRLLGDKLADRFTVVDHDCFDKESNVYLGKTTYGTPVYVNRLAAESDHVVITGAIIYHFLVGWSGGKKAILPGVAAYETIMANHALSLSKQFGGGIYPTVRSGNVQGNPVHEDMLQAASFLRPTFMYNVMVGGGRIIGAVAGNYVTAHAAGRKMVDDTDSVKCKARADMVIGSAGGYPKDMNLYQSIKLLVNAVEATKKGGVIIGITECREGLGGDDDVKNIITEFSNNTDREKDLRDNYSISKFVGFYFCEMAEKYHLILVSSLDPALLGTTKIDVVKTLDEALALAYKYSSDIKTVNVMTHCSNTFPKFD